MRNNQSTVRRVMAGAALVVVAALAHAPAAHAAQTISVQTPMSGIVTNSCPGSEPVQLSGSSHEVFSLTDSGDLQHYSLNFQGVKGVGLETGTTYKLILNIEYTNAISGTETTAIVHGVSVGPGPDNNDLFRSDFHITVNPDGTVTAFFSNFFENCSQ